MQRSLRPRNVVPALLVLAGATFARPADVEQGASVDALLVALRAEYGTSEKKYASLAKKIAKGVEKALEGSAWKEGGSVPLSEHPLLARVVALAAEAEDGHKKKNAAEVKELLTEFPWDAQLELVLGLQYGSDRAIPDHDAGFIDLGDGPDPLPGFPEQFANHYLFGLRQIVGWRYGVDDGKKPGYEGREAKDAPELETELPAWEEIRVYLRGSVPEVPLLAIPQLTHRIHARLAERRAAGGERAPLDRASALLDARWNGFQFAVPYSKKRMAVVFPVNALFADGKGFLSAFPPSARLAEVGDLPFVSILAHQRYGQVFRGAELAPGDFIRYTPEAKAASEDFYAASNYLARYRTLLDMFARAVLAPHVEYPTYMRQFDYPGGAPPSSREAGKGHDVPRKHALLVWAHSGGDPVALADYLHDELLSTDENRFPAGISLPIQLTHLVREREAELVAGIAERIRTARAAEDVPGAFEREFSPFPTYLGTEGTPTADALLDSFHRYHAELAATIRGIALELVTGELPD